MDPKILKEKEKEKLGLIIETAFKLFIILKKYIEDVENNEHEAEEDEDDKEEAENLDVLKQEFDNIFGENNIVGHISALGLDLIRTGFTAVESINFVYINEEHLKIMYIYTQLFEKPCISIHDYFMYRYTWNNHV